MWQKHLVHPRREINMTPIDPDFDLLNAGDVVHYSDANMFGNVTILARSNENIRGGVAYIVKSMSMHYKKYQIPPTFDEYLVLKASHMYKNEQN